MTPNTVLSQSPTSASTLSGRITVVLSSLFLAILFLLHFLEPEFDPSWRMISEYEIGRYGWLMSPAFFCWGGSVLALLVTLWPSLRTLGGKIGRWWLVLLGIALFGAGIFKTNAITDPTPSTANSLHTLCGALVILTFPMVVTLIAASLARHPEWASVRRWLPWGTVLVWLSLFAYFGSMILSNVINPAAGRVGPEVYQGWPNRLMVVVYNLWLIWIALNALRTARQKVESR